MTTPPYNNFNHSKQNFNEFLKNIPNTRYYGSKKRLLPWIYDILKEYRFNTVLDAFGGTASVSLLFQFMGKDVTYFDALSFNRISADVLLNYETNDKIISETNSFFSDIPLKYDGVISRNYQGIFFTDEENAWLDGVMHKIYALNDNQQKNLYLYLIFQASLMKRPFNLFHRANLNLRTAKNIKRNFGNYSTWNRSFYDTVKVLVAELGKKTKTSTKAKILDYKTVEEIPYNYDLVYLDPPYVQSSKKDTYWKKYHFLEGLASYDNMESMIEKKLKINQLKTNQFVENWEEPKQFKDKLYDIIKKHKRSIVVLSYMTNALPSEDELLEFFKQHFEKVHIDYADLSHAMSKGKKTEILVIGVPK